MPYPLLPPAAPPLSAPPAANAGTDQSVNSGDIVNLTGAGSTDDVGISSYSWVQIAGPAGISLTGATINKTVAAGADDFRWEDNDSFLSATGTVLRVGDGTSANYNEHAGWRFTGVAAPQGASISSAALSVRSQGVTGTIPPVRIYGVLATNPAAPTTYAQANGLALTTAFVDWTPSAWSTGTVYATPDISSVIEEIVGQVGWASGNALILVMRDPSGGAFGTAHELMMDAFETAGGTPGSLSITVDGASTNTPSFTAPVVIVPTNYTFQLTVTDADGQTDTDTVIITVNPVSFEGWGVPI